MTAKHLTKTILCSLLWAALPAPSLASPVTFQDPVYPTTVTLSDGRKVPFGVAGVICSNECVEATAEALPDTTGRRRWLLFLPLAALGLILIPNDPPSIAPPPAAPPVDVPEPSLLLLLGLGLLLLSVKLKKELS